MPEIKLCKIEDIPQGGGKAFPIEEDLVIAVFRVGDEVYALDDLCSHDEASLSEGEIVDHCCVKCPRHGSKFDLRTGRPLNLPATKPVRTYGVKIRNGEVFVEL